MTKYIYTLDWLTFFSFCYDGIVPDGKKWENDIRHFGTLSEAMEYLFYQRISYPHLIFRVRVVEVL